MVPLLTVGLDQPGGVLESAARAIALSLPVTARVSAAVLMHGSLQPMSWRVVADLPLGAPVDRRKLQPTELTILHLPTQPSSKTKTST